VILADEARRMRFRPLWSRALFIHALVVVIALHAGSARALHRESTPATQVTASGTHMLSPVRQWGNWIAFTSTQDLASTGSTSQQIFLFNMAYYDCWKGTTLPTTACPSPLKPFLTQITNRPGSPDNPSIGVESADKSTQWLAFDADGTMLGDTGPASQYRQIFLKNLKTEELRQVTFGTNGDSVKPSIASLAGLVVFESTASLTGTPTGGVPQVFAYERQFDLIRRISNGQGPSTWASTNKNGTLVAFQSTADLLGDGHDTGISQIYWAVYDRVNHTSALRRLTSGNNASRKPNLSEDSKLITFESDATNLVGIPGGTQIYMSSPIDVAPVTLRQLTYQSRFGDCTDPAFDPGGNRVGFLCSGDPFENGTTGRRLFILDTDQLRLFQLTGAGDVEPPLTLNVGRWFATLSTTSDLTGNGSCGYQLYLIDYFVDEPGHWMAATSIGELPPDVVSTPGGTNPGNLIGKQTMDFLPGDAVAGSQLAITTSDGVVRAGIQGVGRMVLIGGAPAEFTNLASVRVPAADLIIPPIDVPGIGKVCLKPRADGGGFIDCAGGNATGHLLVSQDHNTQLPGPDNDPACALGCREGSACQTALVGPHTDVCNGPVLTDSSGSTLPGEMQIVLPLFLSLPRSAGIDLTYCTADDDYALRDVPIDVSMTTGIQDTVILDTGDVIGANLAATSTGAPFSCPALQAGVMQGARLEGAAPILDVPAVPGLRDVILSLRLEPKPSPTCTPPCTTAGDCDDGNACNGVEVCIGGACSAGLPVNCDDGDPCNGIETCDPSSGLCQPGPPCDDGDPCNGVETCNLVTGCVPGIPIVCSDGDACNGLETCDPATATCLPGAPPACDDGDPCNGVESCDPLVGCVAGTPINCSDGDPCNGEEVCDPATASCLPGPPPTCDDGNPCTDDSCDPGVGCLHANNVNPCDDGSLCTSNDQCIGGVCQGIPALCDDGDLCNGAEGCDPATGLCQPGVPLDCDDLNPCTADVCDQTLGCLHTPLAGPCDDENVCTTNDNCVAGVCVGVFVGCSDGNVCNGVETCDPVEGCDPGVPLDCDDGNPCTDDLCDPVLGCVHVNNTAPCDDGDLCTSGDQCQGGTCVGLPVACNDGSLCNGIETCDPGTGACLPGTSLVCDDGNECTDDSCDPLLGCVFANNTAPCDDGDACTTSDTCQAGVCSGTPDPVCQASALLATLSGAPLDQVGSPRFRRKLERLVTATTARLEAAGGGRNPRKNLKRAIRLLERFMHLVDRARSRQQMSPALAARLLAHGNAMLARVAVLLAQVVGGA
jgi:hypothetical protein